MRRWFGVTTLLFLLTATVAIGQTGTKAPGGKDAKKSTKKEIDPKDWTPIKIPGKQKAPEFEDIAEWIQSEPLTMKQLRGKVVVVHFMAFG